MSDNSRDMETFTKGDKPIGWVRKILCGLLVFFGLGAVFQGIATLVAKNVAELSVSPLDLIMPAAISITLLWIASRLWNKWLFAVAISSLCWVVLSVAIYPNLNAVADGKTGVEALYIRGLAKGVVISAVAFSLLGGLYLLEKRSAAKSEAEDRLQASTARAQNDQAAKQRASVASEEVWICKKCIGKNPLSNTLCYLCHAVRPEAS